MRTELIRQLKSDEGVRSCVYLCSEGFATIGVGRLVDERRKGAGLRLSEIEFMLRNDIDDRIEQLTRKLPWFQNLDDARRGALVNIAFQVGVVGLLGFKKALAHMEAGRFDHAADEFLLSKWASQTPARAKRVTDQIRDGRWRFA